MIPAFDQMAVVFGIGQDLLQGPAELQSGTKCRFRNAIFPSKKAMCDHWHVPRNVYFARKRAGKSLKECLNPVTHTKPTQSNPMIDHEGRGFVNLDAMCAYWNISKSDYIQNIRNGLDIKRALTERTTRPKHPKDHLGKKYPSINAMCRAWGITKTTLRARLELMPVVAHGLFAWKDITQMICAGVGAGQIRKRNVPALGHFPGLVHTSDQTKMAVGKSPDTPAIARPGNALHRSFG